MTCIVRLVGGDYNDECSVGYSRVWGKGSDGLVMSVVTRYFV